MYNPNAELVKLSDIKTAQKLYERNANIIKTPMLGNVAPIFLTKDPEVELFIKLENMQTTGSFKVRGVLNQLLNLPKGSTQYGTSKNKLISMSAGNYGKAFAYLTNQLGLSGVIFMPTTAPSNRETIIKSYGTEVQRCPTSQLQPMVDKYVKEYGALYLHSFDDVSLIAGHGSLGLEIVSDVPDADVVLVCCGGGGLLSGVAAAIKLSSGHNCRIYGIEPEGACTMYRSFRENKPVSMEVSSIASGLSPPYAGPNALRHCKAFVEDILLVSDSELVSAMFHLYSRGLVVEPSGAAAFAALFHGKVPDVKGKKVVVVITGGNVTVEELLQYSKQNS